MARVVVVGGGLGGLASAGRLAKLGHAVTLVEASDALGGALRPVVRNGWTWDGSAHATLLPAVVRDLFRKSGRPLEREVDLEPLDVIREHRFADGSSVRIPGGSRGAQVAAFDELAPGLGQQWVDYVGRFADDWEVLRQGYFEQPWDPRHLPREVAARFGSRESLRKRLRKSFRDERLRLTAGHPFVAAGHDLRDVPAWAGLTAYLEQRFGAWTVPGGMHRLTEALAERMSTRGVEVLLGTEATDLVVRGGRVAAVATGAGELDAEVVVVAIDPRRLAALRRYVEHTLPAIPSPVTHVGLAEAPDLPAELVLHGDPTLTVRTRSVPGMGTAMSVHVRGKLLEDVLAALARHGIDVHDQVRARVTLGPAQLVSDWGGSPLGVRWSGRGTVRDRLGPRTPVSGVYAAGAHATPGAGIPFVGLGAALVTVAVEADLGRPHPYP